MYSNIPTAKTRNILSDITDVNRLNSDIKYELLTWYDVITKQNYFSNKGVIIIQNKVFIMCTPSSAILKFSCNMQHFSTSPHLQNIIPYIISATQMKLLLHLIPSEQL
jgi:hypothetical protein